MFNFLYVLRFKIKFIDFKMLTTWQPFWKNIFNCKFSQTTFSESVTKFLD